MPRVEKIVTRHIKNERNINETLHVVSTRLQSLNKFGFLVDLSSDQKNKDLEQGLTL